MVPCGIPLRTLNQDDFDQIIIGHFSLALMAEALISEHTSKSAFLAGGGSL